MSNSYIVKHLLSSETYYYFSLSCIILVHIQTSVQCILISFIGGKPNIMIELYVGIIFSIKYNTIQCKCSPSTFPNQVDADDLHTITIRSPKIMIQQTTNYCNINLCTFC